MMESEYGSPSLDWNLTEPEWVSGCEMISNSFQPDPVFGYYYPEARMRQEMYPYIFHQYYVYTKKSHWTVKCQAPSASSPSAAALAVTPNEERFQWDADGWNDVFLPAHNDMIRRFALTPAIAETLIEGNERWDAWFDDKREELLPAHEHGRVVHLVLLNSDPALAGHGYGSNLLRAIQSKANALKAPMYLEATSQKSSELYAKFGFKLLEAAPVPALAGSSSDSAMALPKVYFMRYDPPL